MSSSTPQESRAARFSEYIAATVRRKHRPGNSGARQSPSVPSNTENLPTDILSEIFLYACFGDVHPAYAPGIEANPKSGPQLLSRVCALWRDIVLERPLFWAAIHIRTTTTLSLLKLSIKRSQSLPLTFFWNFDKPDGGPGDFNASAKRYLNVLFSVMDRWEAISVFEWETDELEFTRFRFIGTSSPNTLVNYHLWKPIRRTLQQEPLVSAERRVVLQWKNYAVAVPRTPFPFWGRVTHIDIGNVITPVQCVDILENCVLTVYARFGCLGPYGTRPGRPIVVPELRELVVGTALFDTSMLLSHICCPQLQSLCLGAVTWCHLSHDRMHNFIERSACALQEVIIIDSTLEMSLLECFDDPRLDSFLSFFVCPGHVTEEGASVIFNALKDRLGPDSDVEVERRPVGPRSRWGLRYELFGWKQRRQAAEQPTLQ